MTVSQLLSLDSQLSYKKQVFNRFKIKSTILTNQTVQFDLITLLLVYFTYSLNNYDFYEWLKIPKICDVKKDNGFFHSIIFPWYFLQIDRVFNGVTYYHIV